MPPFPANPNEDEPHPLLARELKAIYGQPAEVPENRDRAMRRAIHDHFAHSAQSIPSGRSVWRVRRAAGWFLAAAASLALILWIAQPWRSHHQPNPRLVTQPPELRDPADLDANGVIDIRDAFALARRIESGEVIAPTGDVNDDGAIDSSDVDLIAARAVGLNGRAGS